MATPHWLTTDEVDLASLTPVMRQVVDIKARHPGTLVFIRLGDFYELFFEDALIAAPLLDMVLTSRNKDAPRPIPMCGFPHHAMAAYVQKAIEEGQRVAVCEQLEDARKVKGMVKRGVTRVITPGVVLESEALDGRRSNNLVSLVAGRDGSLGLAVADVSTGDFQTATVRHATALSVLLVRLEPRELLLPERLKAVVEAVPAARGVPTTLREIPASIRRTAQTEPATLAAAYVSEYLAEVRPSALGLLGEAEPLAMDAHMAMGREAIIHLELLSTARAGRNEGSLIRAVDQTRTVAGGRLLRSLLIAPLADRKAISDRHAAVEALVSDGALRSTLRQTLAGFCDLARVTGRAAGRLVTPRELAMARDTLLRLPEMRALLGTVAGCPPLADLAGRLEGSEPVHDMLAKALALEPRAQVGEGGVIRAGFCARLDELNTLCDDARSWLESFEEQERAATGLSRLRVRYKRVAGYGIEISRAAADSVPEHYRRVQTLKNHERYTTPELKDFEQRQLRAQDDRQAREVELYDALVGQFAAASATVRRLASALAEVDVHAGFAELAEAQGYVRPTLCDELAVNLTASRHAVVEQMLPAGGFVANDLELDAEQSRILLLTGPNMAGKSTLMRQVALSAILCQAGGFVPAERATLPVFDALWTRIGASDDISEGASTFMVEMRETALILNKATPRSLVLLDEIGRGTSTYDGLSIAWAVVEALHDQVGALCLFATHYHELTALSERLPALRNAHVAVKEWGDEVIFIHRLQPGPTNRSHGITVARLAGLPESVIGRARAVLEDLERRARAAEDADGARPRQLSFFDPPPVQSGERPDPSHEALLDELSAVDVDDLSPRAAHRVLAEWVERAAALADES